MRNHSENTEKTPVNNLKLFIFLYSYQKKNSPWQQAEKIKSEKKTLWKLFKRNILDFNEF